MTDPRIIEQHGSRIIAALERAWAAIQDLHPDVPDVVIVTGAVRPSYWHADQAWPGGAWPSSAPCQPQPRRRPASRPKQIDDGPIVCGLCCAPFELPEDSQDTR